MPFHGNQPAWDEGGVGEAGPDRKFLLTFPCSSHYSRLIYWPLTSKEGRVERAIPLLRHTAEEVFDGLDLGTEIGSSHQDAAT